VNLFWTVPLTLPVPGEEVFSKAVFWIHFAFAFTLIGVILVHVAGALQHHVLRRDGTLIRMLPDKRHTAMAISPQRPTLATSHASDAQSVASSESRPRTFAG
jgi:Prokaryotic cytochrome b561